MSQSQPVSQLVSQPVSQTVSDKDKQWSDSGLIKMGISRLERWPFKMINFATPPFRIPYVGILVPWVSESWNSSYCWRHIFDESRTVYILGLVSCHCIGSLKKSHHHDYTTITIKEKYHYQSIAMKTVFLSWSSRTDQPFGDPALTLRLFVWNVSEDLMARYFVIGATSPFAGGFFLQYCSL